MRAEERQARTITIGGWEYPPHLRDVHTPPSELLVRGPRLPTGHLLTVTGSQEPSDEGRRIAYDFGLESARSRVHLVISNATGIDRHALYGAWEGRCESVVVFDSPLPHGGWSIPSAILLTPFGDTRVDARFRAVSAAALCGALGEATVVIEAPRHGTSLEVARAALDGGREVFVHVGGTRGGALCEGSRTLAQEGASVISSYDEVAALLGWSGPGMV
ncbi:MAG TPA: DNA-processing protein DprA [Sphaerochaeta sp.]|jgi:DNA processing protein|nr:DNA-processing protein DprA [Sphaerochaeta sp.]